MTGLSILGSTGSIGTQTLDLVARHPSRFDVVALAAGRNLDLLAEQVRRFRPELVSVADEDAARDLERRVGAGVRIVHGRAGAIEVAAHEHARTVVSAIVGAAGLAPTLRALECGKRVALANKESMVIAGDVMNAAARTHGAEILPVDSEHSAIFQALSSGAREDLQRVLLTASGGPFRTSSAKAIEEATVEQALAHPTWSMGPKISIDSATLMNKGLELIEAVHLFDLEPDQIDVVVHPQSVVHSMVEWVDGSVVAQLGTPDMRTAISLALAHPNRIETGASPLDFASLDSLTFEPPDLERFPCLGLAIWAATAGGSAPAVLSGANEIAVEAFLRGAIAFGDIPRLVEDTLAQHTVTPVDHLTRVLDADAWAREEATRLLPCFTPKRVRVTPSLPVSSHPHGDATPRPMGEGAARAWASTE